MSQTEYNVSITADRKMSIAVHLNNYAASLQYQIEDSEESLSSLESSGVENTASVEAVKDHISNLETLLSEVSEDVVFLRDN